LGCDGGLRVRGWNGRVRMRSTFGCNRCELDWQWGWRQGFLHGMLAGIAAAVAYIALVVFAVR